MYIYDSMEKNLTKFGKYAVNCYYNRGYIGAIISGEFAKGKTATALYMASEILSAIYGLDRDASLRETLNYILFTLDDVIDATNILRTVDWSSLSPQEALDIKFKLRKPVYIWDDAGVHGSSYKQIFDKSDSYELQSNFDTIRDVCSCMIMTVPEDTELMKFLRMYRSNYFVEIVGVSGGSKYDRKLMFFKYRRDPKTGNRKRRLQWKTQNPFSVYVPKEIYGEYDKMRSIAKIQNADRYYHKKKLREAKQKYYELKYKRELEKMGVNL